MIHSLTGTISGVEPNALHLETGGGIEWALQISAKTAETLPGIGESTRVFTYVHHRDDQLSLFGFATAAERSVFTDLLRVGGIGPRQALRILSGMSVEQLVRSLDEENVEALTRVPGLGKKTAQKILLTLRGKLSLRETSSTGGRADDIVEALVEMGFDRGKAKTVVTALRAESPDGRGEEGELLRRAIVRLSARAQEG